MLLFTDSDPDCEVSDQTDSSQPPPDSALPDMLTSPAQQSAGQSVSGHAGSEFALVTLQHNHTGAHLTGQCLDVSSGGEVLRGVGVSQQAVV